MTFEQSIQKMGKEIIAQIKIEAEALGHDVTDILYEAERFAASRAFALSAAIGTAGFDEAVLHERDAVVLRLGIVATGQGDSLDARILSVARSALVIAARAITLIPV